MRIKLENTNISTHRFLNRASATRESGFCWPLLAANQHSARDRPKGGTCGAEGERGGCTRTPSYILTASRPYPTDTTHPIRPEARACIYRVPALSSNRREWGADQSLECTLGKGQGGRFKGSRNDPTHRSHENFRAPLRSTTAQPGTQAAKNKHRTHLLVPRLIDKREHPRLSAPFLSFLRASDATRSPPSPSSKAASTLWGLPRQVISWKLGWGSRRECHRECFANAEDFFYIVGMGDLFLGGGGWRANVSGGIRHVECRASDAKEAIPNLIEESRLLLGFRATR